MSEFWKWLSLVIPAQGLLGGYRSDEKELQSSEGWGGRLTSKFIHMVISRMPPFIAGCWLKASVSHHTGLSS